MSFRRRHLHKHSSQLVRRILPANSPLLPCRFPPRPELNLDASNQAADTSLTLPLVRSLREQPPENLVMLLDLLRWIGRYNLHVCDVVKRSGLRHARLVDV